MLNAVTAELTARKTTWTDDLFVTSQSTIFQSCRGVSSWVEPVLRVAVLSKD